MPRSDGQLVTGRFSNSLQTMIRIDKTNGKETVLNDLYSQYRSLAKLSEWPMISCMRGRSIGVRKRICRIRSMREKAKPVQDGYFYIDGQNKLHKVHDYIDGDPFLAPNGKLYVYDNWRLQVTNLTDITAESLRQNSRIGKKLTKTNQIANVKLTAQPYWLSQS